MLDRKALMKVAIKTCPLTKRPKLDACAQLWQSGERQAKALSEKTGTALMTVYKLKKAWLAAESTNVVAEKKAAIESEMTPAKTADDGTTMISGPIFVSWVDEMMESAKKANDVRNLKLLHDMRSAIIDFGAEMPVTHVDIERTIGLEGLAGMDDVLVDTLCLFFEDIEHYPKCQRFLTQTFGLTTEYWSAANKAAINAKEPSCEVPE